MSTEQAKPEIIRVALSIRQPWAWLIIRPDVIDPAERAELYRSGLIKDVENRTWPTRFRGRFGVHTGKSFDKDGYECVREEFPQIPMPRREDFEMGGIVGSAELYGCDTCLDSDWYMGEWGFLIRDARPLPFIPYRGELGFFKVTP